MTRPLTERRLNAADYAYHGYAFYGTIEDADGWRWSEPGLEMTRTIYIVDDSQSCEDESSSVRAFFTVRFADVDSAEVVEAYAITEKGGLFGDAAPIARDTHLASSDSY